MCMVGRRDMSPGDRSGNSKCRLGYMFGSLPVSLRTPCHLIHWLPRFARRKVKSSLGDETYAYSEMADHVETAMGLYNFWARTFALGGI